MSSGKYILEIQKYFSDPNSSEHSYRTSFENYLKEIFPSEKGYFTQQDQKAINGNKPDFIILKNKVPILYIEVKKVGEDLNKIEKSSQADRYFGYDNLIISDYVNFRFFRNGQKYTEEISLGTIDNKSRIIQTTPNIEVLSRTIVDFTASHKEPIKSGVQLAKIMGGKARRIYDNALYMLESSNERYDELSKMKLFVEEHLISGLTNDTFADMYSQTLVYGLFAARYNDKTPDTFNRQEALDLAPKTNPFLKNFFGHIAGTSFPDRLKFIVDELCEVFTHADIHKLLTDFYGKEKDAKDPIIHFYEDFLKEYDAKKKMDMGVFYTPKPVVDFIVRGVDSILKTEFNLPKGLADTAKIQVEKQETDAKGKQVTTSKEYHKVQILDVATGTGTFLNQTIEYIYKNNFVGQEGMWQGYVKEHLLPRLHGFELMMASYTIAHLKLGMTLVDTGVENLDDRIGVYLTNTLEEPILTETQMSLFGVMDSIANEANIASKIKSEYPIMCVIGNPPYAVSSSNKGTWIQSQIEAYKKGLGEKKINIDDDYIKFIRYAQYMVDKNGEGIVAYISNNSFLSGVTHRKMRESLLTSFSSIYIVDLHGNARLKETSLDGSRDQNVFDIMQGVSINIFVKNSNAKKEKALAKVFHIDLYGDRNDKYAFLEANTLGNIRWQELHYTDPYYFFVPKDFSKNVEYEKGFKVNELFEVSNSGIKTDRDSLFIDIEKNILFKRMEILLSGAYDDVFKNEFNVNDSVSYRLTEKIKNKLFVSSNVKKIQYRPFDYQYIYYDPTIISRPGKEVVAHILDRDNITLNLSRTVSANNDWKNILLNRHLSDIHTIGDQNYSFPLYLYLDTGEKLPNLDNDIWNKISEIVGDTTPENILDYIYAVLHSPTYRETYKEFLKIDFPRVPYPENKEKFFKLVSIGTQLRELHLMSSPLLLNTGTTYSIVGSNNVEKINYQAGNLYINNSQYFGNVPELAWNFYIGGYQPAQKYLKDRKGRALSSDEITHYQKIIKVLIETDKLMKQIDTT